MLDSGQIYAKITSTVGGAVPPTPAVVASTRISAKLKLNWEHSSPVSMYTPGPTLMVLQILHK